MRFEALFFGEKSMFVDSARIFIKSGKGGDGHVSFRREKYVPDGGPDGGDGGHGGSIIFITDDNINTLIDFKHKRKYAAESGEEGGKRRKHGKNGEDLYIKVPKGTIIKHAGSGQIIHDMAASSEPYIILKGGRGGKGNMNYATSVMQAPKYAQPGGKSRELEVILELKCIADVGLIGFPNVGKSTLLSVISNADPKIANYHFTTIDPNLGVVHLDDFSFVVADIPGLIEGASEGIGLGHEFLKHIERCKVLIHVVDAASSEGRDPVQDIAAINLELSKYNNILNRKKQVIAANKMDLIYDDQEKEKIINSICGSLADDAIKVFEISAASRKGIKPLLYHVKNLLDEIKEDNIIFESETSPDEYFIDETLTFTVKKIDDGTYSAEGPKIEKMLGYTNLESEKGFIFFQKFMKEQGIIDEMISLGLEEGDTVKIYGHEFEYFED